MIRKFRNKGMIRTASAFGLPAMGLIKYGHAGAARRPNAGECILVAPFVIVYVLEDKTRSRRRFSN